MRISFEKVQITLLLLCYPALWIYNQKINYQPIISRNTRFLLNSNSTPRDQLYSPTKLINYLKANGLTVSLDPKPKSSGGFGVMGRIIQTNLGTLEVYEYESPKHAMNFYEKNSQSLINVVQNKNLLIKMQSDSTLLMQILGKLVHE